MAFANLFEGVKRMGNRNRNTAVVLVVAGLFLLFGKWIGFFTVSSLILIWLGLYRIRSTHEKSGYVLVIVGVLILLNSHLSVVVAVILISLGYFFIRSKRIHMDEFHLQRQHILGSIKRDKEPWVLSNMSMWCVIGEIRMDLSLAMMEGEETTLFLQGVICDIDMIVPEDVELSVEASVMFGQLDIGERKKSGLLNKIVWESPGFGSGSRRKVRLFISYIVGDIDIRML